jgi:hypothetical protein
VLQCGIPRFHAAFLSDEVEKVQKRAAFRILYPENHYDEALVLSGCSLLSERRSLLCKKTFRKICKPTSRLNKLVPETRAKYELRNNQTFTVTRCRTERVLFPACVLIIL